MTRRCLLSIGWALGAAAAGCAERQLPGGSSRSFPASASEQAPAGALVPAGGGSAPIAYEYPALDGSEVSSTKNRGAPTVLAFGTTYDLASQAQAEFFKTMAKHDGDRVHYAFVALQDAKERELVDIYASRLGLKYPVAIAGKDLSVAAPFGDVRGVPTVFVLDSRGAVTWKREGIAKPDEIRAELKKL